MAHKNYERVLKLWGGKRGTQSYQETPKKFAWHETPFVRKN